VSVVSLTLNSQLWRRLLGPVVVALAIIGLIELAIELKYHPDFWQKTTWLVHDPYRGESFDRVMLYEKLSNLGNSRPEMISVGDSSGFFGIQSKIANRYTHGVSYLSLNTGANYVYLGYRALAEYMLRKPDSRIKWVILYVFPQLLPEESVLSEGTLAPYVNDALVGPLSVLTPPSAFLSPYAKYKIFDDYDWHYGPPMTNAVAPLQLRAQIKQALGWLPEFDVRYDRVDGQFPFPYYRNEQAASAVDARSGILPRLGLAQSSSIYAVYDDFNRMVKSYGAHLAIAFAPVSERAIYPNETHIAEAEAAMARFSRDNPDVKFLFPLISTWTPEKFGTANHVSREYTFMSSMRLGKALGRLVSDPDSIPNYRPRFQPIPLPHITHQITGPADPELLKSAFAFYLYTQTLDESYKELISRRVLDLLEHDEAFRYMMEDAAARARLFAEKHIEIGFDMSQMRARPLAVSGMPHCNERPETQWVQVDGILNFTYKSPEIAPQPEPVRWPESSNIYFTLIKEDGILKFDGYCPESGLALANTGDLAPARPQ
jgi:hypothetical protein